MRVRTLLPTLCLLTFSPWSSGAVVGGVSQVLGSGDDSSNAAPFDRGQSGVRYQQLFKDVSSEPVLISEIAFRPEIFQQGFDGNSQIRVTNVPYGADLNVLLGHGVGTGSLSTNLDGNAVDSLQRVFADPSYSTTLDASGFTLRIPLATPFLYDPSIGSLLVDLRVSSQSTNYRDSTDRIFFDSVNFSSDTERAWVLNGTPFRDVNGAGVGLNMEILYRPVPEPSFLLLLVTVPVLALGRRRSPARQDQAE